MMGRKLIEKYPRFLAPWWNDSGFILPHLSSKSDPCFLCTPFTNTLLAFLSSLSHFSVLLLLPGISPQIKGITSQANNQYPNPWLKICSLHNSVKDSSICMPGSCKAKGIQKWIAHDPVLLRRYQPVASVLRLPMQCSFCHVTSVHLNSMTFFFF